MLLPILLLVGTFVPHTYAALRSCKKSFPSGTATPNDNLMMAMYIADPDYRTGSMRFTTWNGQISAVMVDADVSFSTWKAQEHDAVEDITNLWLYLARLVTSDIFQLYGHYKSIDQSGSNAPNGVIDFDGLKDTFSTVGKNFEQYKDVWPYNCFSSQFFLDFWSALDQANNIVSEGLWSYIGGKMVYEGSMKSLSQINSMSGLGIGEDERSSVLEELFSESMLVFIPDKAQADVFYQSKLTYEALSKLLAGKSAFDSWTRNWNYVGFEQVKDQMNRKCSEHSLHVIGNLYFCKAKQYLEKMESCNGLSDVVPCSFHPLVQDYFSRGRFGSYDELNVLESMISKLKNVLTSIKDRTVSNDLNGLNNIVTSYSSQLSVDDSICTNRWVKGEFDCTNNVGCRGVISDMTYDCNGGYTCRINTMYRFDCMLNFVIEQVKRLTNMNPSGRWGSPDVILAKYNVLMWLSYLPMAEYTSLSNDGISEIIRDTQMTLKNYIVSYDTQSLRNFAQNVPPINFVPVELTNAACQTTSMESRYIVYCNLSPLINSVHLFLDSFDNGQQSDVKVLNPTEDYKERIRQLQLDSAKSALEVTIESNFDAISSSIQSSFSTLSSYFSELADYDKQKADADIGYINGRLDEFRTLITSKTDEVDRMFSLVLDLAIVANAFELVGRTAELGVAVAQVAHPLNQVLGGSSISDLLGAINELAQTAVTSAMVGYLGDQAYEDLVNRGKKLGEGFASNQEDLDKTKELIDKFKLGDSNIEQQVIDFLELYNAYSPAVLRSDISGYGEKWETVSDQLCEAAFSGGTAGAALVEVGLAAKGDCSKISTAISELVTLYEEVYDFQFDLMDALADACRSQLAYTKATDMKKVFTSQSYINSEILRKTAVNSFMLSTMNVWKMVTEFCDVLTYTNGGTTPTRCLTAIRTPSHTNVAAVLGYDPPAICHTNNENTHYRNIPTKPSSSGGTAYIDLDRLYRGETVVFKIPNFQWIRDHWLGSGEPERALYVSRFEIYLPPMDGTSEHQINIEVAPSLPNYLTGSRRGTNYLVPVPAYTTSYEENGHNCFNSWKSSPYQLCSSNPLSQICVTSSGTADRAIQPSVFTEWRIKITSLPANQNPPRPRTDFNIEAGITVCKATLDSSLKSKRSLPNFVWYNPSEEWDDTENKGKLQKRSIKAPMQKKMAKWVAASKERISQKGSVNNAMVLKKEENLNRKTPINDLIKNGMAVKKEHLMNNGMVVKKDPVKDLINNEMVVKQEHSFRKNILKRSAKQWDGGEERELLQKRAADKCCSRSQYWNGSACTNCPSGSSPRLGGYYCE